MYPLLKDNNFQKKIALKKEFQMKYDGEKKDILKVMMKIKKRRQLNQQNILIK